MTSTDMLTWGILGCANIARKVIPAIREAENNELVAIASRSLEKVVVFAAEMELPDTVTLYDSYQKVLDDERVSAVYIPLPTTLHLEWVTRAADAGKHVLIEKPVAVNAAEFHLMMCVCRSRGVLLMDGTMFMHHKRTANLKSMLSSPDCGEIVRVDCSFSFPGSREFFETDIRTKADADPLGALGDLGWYCARLGIIAFSGGVGIRLPRACSAIAHTWTADRVPLDVEARVYFGDGHSELLAFNCSFLLPFRQHYEICCKTRSMEQGDVVVTCEDFVLPMDLAKAQLIRDISPPPARPQNVNPDPHVFEEVVSETADATQQCRMLEAFSGIVLSCTASESSAAYWPQIALTTQAVLDACLLSMQQDGAEVEVKNLLEQYI